MRPGKNRLESCGSAAPPAERIVTTHVTVAVVDERAALRAARDKLSSCIRMRNHDIVALGRLMPVGTPLTVR
jgi:hypothetical protein